MHNKRLNQIWGSRLKINCKISLISPHQQIRISLIKAYNIKKRRITN